jgi:hypothetical protein
MKRFPEKVLGVTPDWCRDLHEKGMLRFSFPFDTLTPEFEFHPHLEETTPDEVVEFMVKTIGTAINELRQEWPRPPLLN